MADEQYRWLDREVAERLLRGEPLDAVDAANRDEVKRLAWALDALVPEPSPKDDELPGEDGALTAFRAARAAAARRPLARSASDGGLVQIGRPVPGRRRPRWGMPVRYALVAVFAGGMIGGVAVAAGTGALPFTDREPDPGASVTTAATPEPEEPLLTPRPSRSGSPESATPQDPGMGSADRGAAKNQESRGASTTSPGQDGEGSERNRWAKLVSACRALREGRPVGPAKQRLLDEAVKGAGQRKYCKEVLALADGHSGKGKGKDRGSGRNGGKSDDKADGGDDTKGGDRDGDRGGDGRGRDGDD